MIAAKICGPLLVLALSVGCAADQRIRFIYFNDSLSPVHMWGPNEEMGPSNRVESLSSRTELLPLRNEDSQDFRDEVHVGQNGQALDFADFFVSFSADCSFQLHEVEVFWNGSQLNTNVRENAESNCD